MLPTVNQYSVDGKPLVGFRHDYLIRPHDAFEVGENRPQVHEFPCPTDGKRTGGLRTAPPPLIRVGRHDGHNVETVSCSMCWRYRACQEML